MFVDAYQNLWLIQNVVILCLFLVVTVPDTHIFCVHVYFGCSNEPSHLSLFYVIFNCLAVNILLCFYSKQDSCKRKDLHYVKEV